MPVLEARDGRVKTGKPLGTGTSTKAKESKHQSKPSRASQTEPTPVDSAEPDAALSEAAKAQAAREEQACREAALIRDCSAGVTMGWVAKKVLDPFVGVAGGQAYRNNLVARAGEPEDPVELMLLEQLALAHIQSQRLHVKLCEASGPEATKILTGATARMACEFRRLALAIKAYRAPATNKQVTVVRNNVAHGDQQVAVMVQSSGDNKCFSEDTKLPSKQETVAKQVPNETPQPKASCRRPG